MSQPIHSFAGKRPCIAAWFAAALLLLFLLPAASHATTFYDDLNDWSYTASHTTNLTFDTANSSYFQGDASRVTRTVDDTESFTYAESNISNFNIGYYTYAGTLSQLSVYYSTDSGSTWSSAIALSSNGRVSTSGGWGYYILWPTNSLPAGVTNIKIQLASGSGNAWDPQIPFVTVTYSSLDTPAAVNAEPGAGQNYLTWANVPGASSYNVYRSTSSGGEGATPVATGITTASYSPHYTDTGLTNGTKYYYTVTAVNPNTESSQSSEVSATPAVGYSVVEDDLGDYSKVSTQSTNFTGLDSSSSPFFNYDQSRAERTSDTTEYLIYKYSVIRDFAVRLHTFGTGTINDFGVYYSTDGGATYNSLAINTGSGTTPWTIWGNGWEYYNIKPASALPDGVTNIKFQISSTGNSWDPQIGHIDISYSVPDVPTGLSDAPGNAQNTISWTASPGAVTYNLYRSTTAGGEGGTPYKTGLTGTSYTDTGLTNGTRYYYTLTAVGTSSESAQSSEVSGIANTTGTTCYQINSGGTATGSWSADMDYSGGSTSTTANAITTSAVDAGPSAVYQSMRSGSSITYTLNGLTPSASYVVRLHEADWTSSGPGQREFNLAVNGSNLLTNFDIYAAAGAANTAVVRNLNATSDSSGNLTIAITNGAAGTAQVNGIEVITGSVLSAPTSPSASATNAQVVVSWTAPTGTISSYNLYRSTSAGTEGSTPYKTGIASGATSYTDTGVANGTTYYYKIVAVNAIGESGLSTEASTQPNAPPTAPTNVAAVPGNASVTLSWTASTGGGTITYTVERSTVSGGPYAAVTGGSGLSGTSFTDPTGGTAPSNGTKYYYIVVASNNGGTASSSEVYATPDPPTLLLAKRITAINGVAVTGFVTDGTGNDTNAYWPSPSSTYLRGGTTSTASPGDTIEYTIYYLVTGSGSVTNISISDILPANTTFASTVYNGLTPTDGGSGNSGIALASSGSAYPTSPTVYMSNASDSDRGTFYAPGVAVSGICTAAQNVSGVVVVNVVTTPTTLPASTSAASPYNAYGFIRFELTVN